MALVDRALKKPVSNDLALIKNTVENNFSKIQCSGFFHAYSTR